MTKAVFLGIIFSCTISFANAQSLSREVIAAGGDLFVTPAGSLSWTLGETVIETVQNSSVNLILTQGFQQPDEMITDTVGVPLIVRNNFFANLYPNPAAHLVRLDMKYDANSTIKIELVDMLGRVLHDDELEVIQGQLNNYQLDIRSLASGMYMFRLTGNGQLLNSYKFQKAN